MIKKETAKKETGAELKPTDLPLPHAARDHHGKTIDPILAQWSSSSKVSPVLLLTGPRGVGKKKVALHLAQWLLCERNPLNEAASGLGGGLFGASFAPADVAQPTTLPCRDCAACRGVEAGQSLNLTEISAEPTDTGRAGTLKIEQFRELRENQGFGAFEGSFRIILISGADQLTTAAGNSLLKILEEPPPGWVFLLTANDSALVLPTLVSRCQKIRLRPFPLAELEALLAEEGVPGDRRRTCADLAQGSWGKALELAEDETWSKRGELMDFLGNPAGHLEQWVDWAAQDSKQFQFLLDQLEFVSHRLIQFSLSDSPESNDSGTLKKHFDTVTRAKGSSSGAREFWTKRADQIREVRDRLHLPLNRKLLAQQVLLPWMTGH